MGSGPKAVQGRYHAWPEWESEPCISNDRYLHLRDKGPVMLLERKAIFTQRRLKPFGIL